MNNRAAEAAVPQLTAEQMDFMRALFAMNAGNGVGPADARAVIAPEAPPNLGAAAAAAAVVGNDGGAQGDESDRESDHDGLLEDLRPPQGPRNVFSLFGRKRLKEARGLFRAPLPSHRSEALRFCEEDEYKGARVLSSHLFLFH